MRIGFGQINTIVGDLEGNRVKILQAYKRLVGDGAELVVFPELAVCGYPPRDLLFKRRFVTDVEDSLMEIAAATGPVPAVVGFVETNPAKNERPFFNSAAWCDHGEIRHCARKSLLPTYDVFDEDRYFQAARSPAVWRWRGLNVGLTICEDIWAEPRPSRSHPDAYDPVAVLAEQGVDLLLNLSASPWHRGKSAFRESFIAEAARRCGCPLAYCNAVGGNDELIFDGRSLIAGADGKVTAVSPAFTESLKVFDTESHADEVDLTYHRPEIEDIHDALVLGLRDYVTKSGFSQVIVGLSGGIDSSVTATLAVTALGKDNVLGISNPSAISSRHSRDDAAALAENLGIRLEVLPIAPVVDAAEQVLAPLFRDTQPGVAEENIQARTRGLLWMAISNKFGHLVLTCGNKSELAVGYCTLYGDMSGGLAVISDLPKTKVYALAEYQNRNGEVIPRSVIEKAPSAELRPDQKDEDTLPPYPALDDILEKYVEEGCSSRDLIRLGYEESLVRDIIRRVDLNEYKRQQAPPGLKITPLAFGVGRRIPIVQKYVN